MRKHGRDSATGSPCIRAAVAASLLVLGTWLLFTFSSPAAAQSGPCELRQIPKRADDYGYRARWARCEGRYKQPAAATTLTLVSLIESFDRYDLQSVTGLTVEWAEPFAGREVHLRAQRLRQDPEEYYRMDTRVSGEARTFGWSADVISGLKIPAKELGVLGWVRTRVGNVERDVYLPLRIGSARTCCREQAEKKYRLVFRPLKELEEVKVSLRSLGEDGQEKDLPVFLDQDLGYSSYPARRGTAFNLAGFKDPGVYHVKISAKQEDDTGVNLDLWLYHSR